MKKTVKPQTSSLIIKSFRQENKKKTGSSTQTSAAQSVAHNITHTSSCSL